MRLEKDLKKESFKKLKSSGVSRFFGSLIESILTGIGYIISFLLIIFVMVFCYSFYLLIIVGPFIVIILLLWIIGII